MFVPFLKQNPFYNKSIIFIFANVLVAVISFAKSLIFMSYFDIKSLGLLTLFNTIAMFVSFFQIGTINGGYRIIALQKREDNIKTQNLIFSYFSILTIAILSIFLILNLFYHYDNLYIVISALVFGILSLFNNWLSNALIAKAEYRLLNKCNLVSAFVSLLALFLLPYFQLASALFCFLMQPLIFIAMALYFDKNLRPNSFVLQFDHFRYILNFGFIPFLSGIFFLLYQQIERFSINYFLGPEGLGEMYLVFLVSSIWLLIPSSINSLFFPRAIKSYSEKRFPEFRKVITKYSLILILYCFISAVLLFFFLPFFLREFYESKLLLANLALFSIPALVTRTLSDPLSLFYNSLGKLKPIFISDLLSLVLYCFSVFLISWFNLFTLENMILAYISYSFIKILVMSSFLFKYLKFIK